jgi:hypothetical protein
MKSLQENSKRKKRTKTDTRSGKKQKQKTTSGFTVTNAEDKSDQESDESDIEKMSVDSLRTLVKGYRQSPNAVEINNNDILVADFNLHVIEDY